MQNNQQTKVLTATHDMLRHARLTAIDILGQAGKPYKLAIVSYFDAITKLQAATKAEPYLSELFKSKLNEARREARSLVKIEQRRKAGMYSEAAEEEKRFIAMLERGL